MLSNVTYVQSHRPYLIDILITLHFCHPHKPVADRKPNTPCVGLLLHIMVHKVKQYISASKVDDLVWIKMKKYNIIKKGERKYFKLYSFLISYTPTTSLSITRKKLIQIKMMWSKRLCFYFSLFLSLFFPSS